MTNSKGYRRGTRDMLSRPFRKHGVIPLGIYLKAYKQGGIIDIKGHGAVQKRIPYKRNPYAFGVIVNKRVSERIIPKRTTFALNMSSTQHAEKTSSDVSSRMKKKLKEAKAKGVWVNLKRQPKPPKKVHFVKKFEEPIQFAQIPYEFIA